MPKSPTPQDILSAADPGLCLDHLDPGQALNEALEVSLFAVQEQARRWSCRNRLDAMGAEGQGFTPQQLRYAQGLLEIVEDNGPWIQGAAQYQEIAAQPETACARCLFYQGQKCAIVLGQISPSGTCRFVVSPATNPNPETAPRNDAHEPPRRIINWYGLRLGLSHYPGDLRHGRPMTAYYGHVRGTYGQAEDGMAVDVYLADPDTPDVEPGALEEFLPNTVFRVRQIVPDTGELDECKFILGAADIDAAEAVYLAHMPPEFFGGIDFAELDDIKPCRGDSGESLEGCDRTSPSFHLDARQMIHYQGLTIGVTHTPGDRRFNQFGKPMSSSYGFIAGSYGDGLDGKALDAYLAPGFDPSVSRPVWRISQRNPDSGTLDEYKYMFGYQSHTAAKEDYIFHCGRDRFGLIHRATTAELDPYRRLPLAPTTAGSIGIAPRRSSRTSRTTKTKPRSGPQADDDGTPGPGERRQPTFNRDGWLGVSSLRQDSTDPDTLGEQMAQRLTQQAAPITTQWLKASRQWLQSQGSLEAALRDLEQSPEHLLEQMQLDELGEQVFQAMLLADFAGREEVIDEADPDEIRLDSQILHRIQGHERHYEQRLDAPSNAVPPWLDQDFEEAVGYFLDKVNIPVESYAGVTADYHDWAFSVAHMTQADWLEDAKSLLNGAITQGGQSFDDFVADWEDQISSQGWEPGVQGAQRLWTIYNTNVRGAMGAGRYAQMNDPGVLAQRNLWLWRWRDSPNPRKHHQALHMKAIPVDNPFWRGLRVPAGWGCRCSIFAISEDYAQRNGIEILTNPPAPETIADPEFRTPYNAEAPYGGRDRIEFLTEKLEQYPPKLRAVLTERMNRTPPPPPMPPPPGGGSVPIRPSPPPLPPTPTLETPQPAPPPRSPAGLIQRGAERFADPVKQLDDAIAQLADEGQASSGKILDELREEFRANAPKEKLQALAQDYAKAKELELERLRRPLQQIEDSLLRQFSGLAAYDAAKAISTPGFDQRERSELINWMVDVIKLTNGKAVSTLDLVLKNSLEERAFASENNRLISLGADRFKDRDYSRATLFHEMGHHVEFSNPEYAEAARQWMRSKATSQVPERLSVLTGNAGYGPDEVALPGDFVSPYVAKIYPDGYTEVISMGLEAFSSTEAMLTLYRADREHFLFMLGLLGD